MLRNSGQLKEYNSVYPGQYQPFPFDTRGVSKELHMPIDGTSKPVVNVIEFADHFRIEVVAPGHKTDDFVVIADKGLLNVFAVRRQSKHKEKFSYQTHEVNDDCFEHSIQLPENTDTDFVSGEYKAGILSICCSKTEKPAINTLHQIIIY